LIGCYALQSRISHKLCQNRGLSSRSQDLRKAFEEGRYSFENGAT
jgi:hypothetical protein